MKRIIVRIVFKAPREIKIFSVKNNILVVLIVYALSLTANAQTPYTGLFYAPNATGMRTDIWLNLVPQQGATASNNWNIYHTDGGSMFSVNFAAPQASIQVGSSKLTNFLVNGNVGIGTISPEEKLDVNGGISIGYWGRASSNRNPVNNYTNLFLGGAIADQGNGIYKVLGDGGSNYFAGIKMDNSGSNAGAIKFYSRPSTGGSNYQLTNSELENYVRMTIVNGNVGIGTSNPTQKLTVKGTIYSTEVKVDLAAGTGPDYVFEPTYALPSLDSVQLYINQNKHLPEVPSAKEMEANGVNLGEMNMLLLKKVEELTLYVIEQNKTIQLQNERIDKLEKSKP